MRTWLVMLALASCGDDDPHFELVQVPIAVSTALADETEPRWPIYATASCDETCRFERYHRAWMQLQGMEVGGMEMMIGEGLAGSGLLIAATTPAHGAAPSVTSCEALGRVPAKVVIESLQQPQRDCYFDCMRGSDPQTCARDKECGVLPILDGAWTVAEVSPRLGCLARLDTPVIRSSRSYRCRD